MRHQSSSSRFWLPEGIALLLAALLGTLPFWLTDLDLRVAALFHQPGADDAWSMAQSPIWSFLYVAAPMLTGLLVIGALLVLVAGQFWGHFRRRRCYAVLLIWITILGPGLLVNALLKEHWNRPRPHQIEQFGGTRHYVPPLAISTQGKGKSFPSGHASVGYMLGVFFMIWMRRRPLLAWGALIGSLALGTLLGIGRMAAGDHFLSDVIWAAVIAYGIAWVLYYFVLRIPQREAAAAVMTQPPPSQPTHRVLKAGAFIATVALTILAVLFTSPVKNIQTLWIRPSEGDTPPRILRLLADDADVILYWVGGEHRTAQIRLEARGFAPPWSKVEGELTQDPDRFVYRITHRGPFLERDTTLSVGLVAVEWDLIEAWVDSGNIQIDRTRGLASPVDAQTADGVVTRVWPKAALEQFEQLQRLEQVEQSKEREH